jgi:hypothetical protein
MTDIGKSLVVFVIVLEKYLLAGSTKVLWEGTCWSMALLTAENASGDNSD